MTLSLFIDAPSMHDRCISVVFTFKPLSNLTLTTRPPRSTHVTLINIQPCQIAMTRTRVDNTGSTILKTENRKPLPMITDVFPLTWQSQPSVFILSAVSRGTDRHWWEFPLVITQHCHCSPYPITFASRSFGNGRFCRKRPHLSHNTCTTFLKTDPTLTVGVCLFRTTPFQFERGGYRYTRVVWRFWSAFKLSVCIQTTSGSKQSASCTGSYTRGLWFDDSVACGQCVAWCQWEATVCWETKMSIDRSNRLPRIFLKVPALL